MTSLAQSYLKSLHDIVSKTIITDHNGENYTLDEAATEFSDTLFDVKNKSSKAILVGNGGSASIADHLQNDLCATVGARAMVCTNTPLLTALSNDKGYESAYENQVKIWANTGDLFIAISSSGESENILRAAQIAQATGCRVVTMTGFRPTNRLRKCGYLNFYVNSDSYGHTELSHSIIAHLLTDWACSRHWENKTFSTNIQATEARLRQTGLKLTIES